MPDPQFSFEQLEQMRQILAQHGGNNKAGINEFDLNKPPQKPYRFQEFPKCLYNHETRKYLTVHSKEQEDAEVAKGWKLEPFSTEVAEFEPDAAEAAEIAKLDRIARSKKKKAE